MSPQWTNPLDLSTLTATSTPSPSTTLPTLSISPSPRTPSPPPKPLKAPSFDYESQFHSAVHDVPTTPQMRSLVRAAEHRFNRYENLPPPRPHHNHPTNPFTRLPLLRPRARARARSVRLNRLHPPVPVDLASLDPPVRSEFMRVSTVAARRYATPPDPADDHDHSIFDFPSIPPCREDEERSPEPISAPLQEPRRRNIQHLIERYNQPAAPVSAPAKSFTTATNLASTPNTPIKNRPRRENPYDRSPPSTLSPATTASATPQFNIQSVRDIFERHTPTTAHSHPYPPPHPHPIVHTEISLSSVTDSASPPQKLQDNRPQRIAFADLTNTLDLSPCASSASVSSHSQIPVITPPRTPPHTPPRARKGGVLLPDGFATQRKKSFPVFGRERRERVRSFANGERERLREMEGEREGTQARRAMGRSGRGRRFTTAERPRKTWVVSQLRACGGSVRRRLESFRNMISADDY